MNFKKYGRTAQLFDYQTMSEGLVGGLLNSDGTITVNAASSSWIITKYIPVAGREFTLQRQASGGATSICLYDSNQTYITGLAYNGNGTVTVSANTDVSYIRFTYYRTENTGNIMLNEGSTALPHEPYGDSWHDTPHYIHNTSTDTITTLPAVLYPNGTTATVGLKGNTTQNGTPTRDNPIMPQGTGERTRNVMPAGEQKTVKTNGVTFSSDGKGRYHISGTATAIASAQFNLLSAFTTPISVSNGGQGTLSFFNTQSDNNVYFTFYNGATKVDDWRQAPIRRTSTAYNAVGNNYVDNVVIAVHSGATVDMTITPEFTNDGILPSEFEPYGIKIPISSASTTTPVYLGEVETTRKIKKLVLTGKEDFSNQYGKSLFSLFLLPLGKTSVYQSFCTHYKYNPVQSGLNVGTANGEFALQLQSTQTLLAFKDTNYTSLTDFKSYLAQQYAAGTPVTVWYVLATEETGIVNEPLMKIGTYADEVSGITIPVTAGGNTLSVGTTVQPSEVTVNYKGWHPIQSVHERENGAWT